MADIRFKSKPKVTTLEDAAGIPCQEAAGDKHIEAEDLLSAIPAKTLQMKTGLANPADAEGLMFWDDTNKCLAYHTDVAGVTNQVSQEDWTRVYNDTAGIILNGSACFFTGNHNNELE